MPYENAFLKFNSRQKSKNTRYNIKKISSGLGMEFKIETAKGLAKKFKQKCLFSRDLLSGNRLPVAKMTYNSY